MFWVPGWNPMLRPMGPRHWEPDLFSTQRWITVKWLVPKWLEETQKSNHGFVSLNFGFKANNNKKQIIMMKIIIQCRFVAFFWRWLFKKSCALFLFGILLGIFSNFWLETPGDLCGTTRKGRGAVERGGDTNIRPQTLNVWYIYLQIYHKDTPNVGEYTIVPLSVWE